LDSTSYIAPRYGGLPDVLRDITPDAWGKYVLRKEYELGLNKHEFDYLMLSSNVDRWGALTISKNKKPSGSQIVSPRTPKLNELLEELQRMATQQPAKYPTIRKRLVRTTCSGGARPKTTVQDGNSFWMVKPTMASDDSNVALFEHACMQMGRAAGLNVSNTNIHRDEARTAVFVERFDRYGDKRHLVVSGATLLSTEYPAVNDNAPGANALWSYPQLAASLRRIGCPDEDLIELFGRMIFNILIGNDDDHPRNHAAIWRQGEGKWRISPAFDIVPNLVDNPRNLSMQLSRGRWSFAKESVLADWQYFSFKTISQAERAMRNIVDALIKSSQDLESFGLDVEGAELIRQRMLSNAQKII
jgi:serine/threonine-protein kinase HipA